MLDLWIIRHAESLGNVDGSESDTSLSPRGVDQARALATATRSHRFDRVWVSPLVRAVETAEHAFDGVLHVDARLSEFIPPPSARMLDTSGMSVQEMHALLMSTVDGSGESGSAFKARVKQWLSELPPSGSVAVVTHFAVVREILGAHLGFDKAPQRIAHSAIFRLAIVDAQPRAVLWNDTTHLDARARQ